jgi:chromosome segregation ATPase
VHGRLSELGRIASRRYNLAMSVALGQHMDSIVVDDRATAFKAVDWLKRTRCARSSRGPEARSEQPGSAPAAHHRPPPAFAAPSGAAAPAPAA